MIREFFIYMLGKPGKIVWVMFINVFCIGCVFYCFNNFEDFITYNPAWLFYVIIVILVGIWFAGNYHPYKEWKDGKDVEDNKIK